MIDYERSETFTDATAGVLLYRQPELSDWQCNLFGGNEEGITWRPIKGKEPNWFWRWMQFLCFGNKWRKVQ